MVQWRLDTRIGPNKWYVDLMFVQSTFKHKRDSRMDIYIYSISFVRRFRSEVRAGTYCSEKHQNKLGICSTNKF
jgi:hypothetical protein